MADGINGTGAANVTTAEEIENKAIELAFDSVAQSIMQSMFIGEGIAAELRSQMDEE